MKKWNWKCQIFNYRLGYGSQFWEQWTDTFNLRSHLGLVVTASVTVAGNQVCVCSQVLCLTEIFILAKEEMRPEVPLRFFGTVTLESFSFAQRVCFHFLKQYRLKKVLRTNFFVFFETKFFPKKCFFLMFQIKQAVFESHRYPFIYFWLFCSPVEKTNIHRKILNKQ